MNSKLMNILRWIFILPLCLLSMFLIQFPLHFIVKILYYLKGVAGNETDNFFSLFQITSNNMEAFLIPSASVFAFILTSFYIAPNAKNKVVLIALIINLAFLIFCLVVPLFNISLFKDDYEMRFYGIHQIVAGVFGILMFKELVSKTKYLFAAINNLRFLNHFKSLILLWSSITLP